MRNVLNGDCCCRQPPRSFMPKIRVVSRLLTARSVLIRTSQHVRSLCLGLSRISASAARASYSVASFSKACVVYGSNAARAKVRYRSAFCRRYCAPLSTEALATLATQISLCHLSEMPRTTSNWLARDPVICRPRHCSPEHRQHPLSEPFWPLESAN